MMLEHLGEAKAAAAMEEGIKRTASQLKSMAAGRMGYDTTQVGDMVAKYAVEALA